MNLPLFSVLTLALLTPFSAPASVAWHRIESSSQGILPAPDPKLVEPTAALVCDVDGDGDQDIIIAGRKGAPAVALWRFDAGSWRTEIIEPAALRLEASGAVHDIDGDGDPDIVFAGDNASGEIWWWENPHPAKGTWTRRTIKTDSPTKHHDQVFGDFDGDGRMELVSWNQNGRRLLLFEIPDEPRAVSTWPATEIFRWPPPAQFEGLARADVDGDGVDDIVGAGHWFRHTGGGQFAVEAIDSSMTFSRVATGQLVPGGRPEIVFCPGDTDGALKWHEWRDGAWVGHVLEPNIIHGHSLEIADIDGDGHNDIMVGEMGHWTVDQVNHPHARVMVFYGDGAGNFRRQIVSIGQGVHEARLGDLDGDGRPDIVGKPFRHNNPKLIVWLNRGRIEAPLALERWQRHLIDGPLAPYDTPLPPPQQPRRLFVAAADLDGDGWPDLVTGGTWHCNPGRIGGNWERREIGSGFGNFAVAHDFDGDGDIDLLGTTSSFKGNQFVLALNDGRGGFSLRTDLPAGSGDFLQGATVARLGGRQNSIVLSWHRGNDLETLTYPVGAPDGPWTLGSLGAVSQNEAVSLGDIDRDSDVDLLLGVQWLRNDNDRWSAHQIGAVGDLGPRVKPDRNRLFDLNGDGRLDAVVGLENGTRIFWFEQPAGDPTQTWKRHEIADIPGQGFSLDVADFDGDGDFDIVVGEHRNPSGTNRVVLIENLDGAGGEWRQHVIDQGPASEIDHHNGTVAVDLDGDGDLDLASIGWFNSKLWVLENKARDPR